MNSKNIKVLLIEDDTTLGNTLTIGLNHLGYEVHYISSFIAVISAIEEFRPSIIVTDVELKGKDGITEAKKILDQLPDMPIIVISSHKDDIYVSRALDGGCVAYIKKPFSLAELSAYINRHANYDRNSTSIQIGALVLNYKTRDLIDPQTDTKIHLSSKTCGVLLLLKKHQNNLVTREMLQQEVWIGEVATDHAINNAISQIRNMLPSDSTVTISTIRNVGYMMLCDQE